MDCFRRFIFDNNLLDLHSKGQKFTWSNKSRDDELLIRVKLDRVLTNKEWLMRFENATLINLPMIGSDHTSLLLNTESVPNKRGGNFIFDAFWVKHKDCKGIVEKCGVQT